MINCEHSKGPERLHTLPTDSLWHQESISVQDHGLTYTAFFSKISLQLAQNKCIEAGGNLPRLDTDNAKGILYKIMRNAQKCAGIVHFIYSFILPIYHQGCI